MTSRDSVPPCGPNGPSVQVTIVALRGGRPPGHTLSANVRISNPLSRPVWMFFNADERFPTIVTQIDLSTTAYDSPRVFKWHFYGNTSADALALADETDILLRDVLLSTKRHATEVWIRFADELLIDGQNPMLWLGENGLCPRRGEYSMRTLESIRDRKTDHIDGFPVTMRVLCVQRVALEHLY